MSQTGQTSSLTARQRDVLEQWTEVAETEQAGVEFDFGQYDRTQQITQRADEFIESPTRDGFESMWDRMHAASQRGRAGQILSKWDGSIADLAALIETVRDASQYDSDWEDRLGAKATIQELFGHLHIEDYPIINAATESGLAFFGYDTPTSYTDGVEAFEAFLDTYERIVGHATADADHGVTVPIRLEVDQLFNVIDKADESSIEDEQSGVATELYKTILHETTREDTTTPDLADFSETNPTPYWVNQSNEPELIDEYLKAKVDTVWHHDLETVEAGDIILHHYEDELVAYSVATGEHETYTFQDQEYQRIGVDIHWFDDPIIVDAGLKQTLGEDQYRTDQYYVLDSHDNFKQAYLSRLSDDAAEYLLQKAGVSPPEGGTIGPHGGPYVKPENAGTIERQLKQNKQVVFYGPPGTSKTYEAKQFAEWWTRERTSTPSTTPQVRTVTFHPSFSYEDFLEGLTADATDDGTVTYDVEDGVLKRIAADATDALEATPDDESPPPFVLIIDEINRGNLAQIFGEVITLLEADKRATYEVELAHSGESFTLPPNLYLIGTMNTADQSIALVDTALRRRFRFIDYPPDLDTVLATDASIERDAAALVREDASTISDRDRLLGASILAVEELNTRILDAPQLGKGKQLGHTYLMGHDSVPDIVDAWRYDILPQLEEYYFGQTERLRQELLDDTGSTWFDWDTERIQPFTATELYDVLCTLAGIDDPVPLAEDTNSPTETTTEPAPSSQDGLNDSWANGERTPETFRERIQHTLTEDNAAKFNTIMDAGEDVARLDPGSGEQNAKLMVKSDRVNPNVGIVKLEQDGTIGFRWDWLTSNDNAVVSPEFVADAATAFESIPGYTHNWGSEAESSESPKLAVDDLSMEDAEALAAAIRKFVDRAAEHE